MKKATAALASTAAGIAAVVGLHSAGGSVLEGGKPPATAPPATAPEPSGSASAPTTTRPGVALSAVGTSEQYGYGTLSVKATVSGRRLVDVSVVNLQTAESYSQSLAQQVIPMLRSEVLAAQSARVNGISGATYTSEAYLYSLQSALDKLHF